MNVLVKGKTTAEELWQLPNDGYRYELVDGELIRMPPASEGHGRRAIRFAAPLAMHVYANKLGEVYAAETGYKIDVHNVRAPDVSFISYDRLDAIGRTEKFFTGAPDLAVEVASPGDTKKELREKAEWWLSVGARLVFTVEPKNSRVKAYCASGEVIEYGMDDEIEGFDVVPDFKLAVSFIFSDYAELR